MSRSRRIVGVSAAVLLALGPGLAALGSEPATPAAPPAPPPAEKAAAQPLTAEEIYEKLTSLSSFSEAELAQAGTSIADARRREPADVRWKLADGILMRLRGDAKGSVTALEALSKENPKNPEIFFHIGQSTMATITRDTGFMTMADIAGDAKKAWSSAVKVDPGHVRSLYALTQYEIRARQQGGILFGSYGKARKHAEALFKSQDPSGKFWGHISLANVASAEEEWEEMSKQYLLAEQAAGNPRQTQQALRSHADSLIRDKKDGATAKPVIDRLQALADPQDFSIHYLRAESMKLAGDCKGAIEWYLKVIAINENALNSRISLAQCYEQVGDSPAALQHYEQFIQRFPQDSRADAARKAIKMLKKSAGPKG